MVEAPN